MWFGVSGVVLFGGVCLRVFFLGCLAGLLVIYIVMYGLCFRVLFGV